MNKITIYIQYIGKISTFYHFAVIIFTEKTTTTNWLNIPSGTYMVHGKTVKCPARAIPIIVIATIYTYFLLHELNYTYTTSHSIISTTKYRCIIILPPLDLMYDQKE